GLRSRRVRCVCDSRRRLFDLRLAGRLLSRPALLDRLGGSILARTARPAALAALAETLAAAATPARLVLVAQPGVALLGRAFVARRHDLALIDPDLDADPAGRRLRLGEAVVDVRADRVQRHAALRVALGAAHFAAAEPAAALHLHTLGA